MSGSGIKVVRQNQNWRIQSIRHDERNPNFFTMPSDASFLIDTKQNTFSWLSNNFDEIWISNRDAKPNLLAWARVCTVPIEPSILVKHQLTNSSRWKAPTDQCQQHHLGQEWISTDVTYHMQENVRFHRWFDLMMLLIDKSTTYRFFRHHISIMVEWQHLRKDDQSISLEDDGRNDAHLPGGRGESFSSMVASNSFFSSSIRWKVFGWKWPKFLSSIRCMIDGDSRWSLAKKQILSELSQGRWFSIKDSKARSPWGREKNVT